MSYLYTGGYIGVSVAKLGGGRRTRHEHDLIAEKALGKPLPKGALVHHVNEDRADNRNENLVICPNRAYHGLLHLRMRALAACGNADSRQCVHCGKWDDVANMSNHGKRTFKHRACHTAREKERRNGS